MGEPWGLVGKVELPAVVVGRHRRAADAIVGHFFERVKMFGKQSLGICNIQRSLLLLPVELVAIQFGPKSQMDIALVSLYDASEVGCEVEYALSKAVEYYTIADKDTVARQRCKFYLDDVALRLYAAAEHVAHFVVAFVDIDENALKPYRKRRASLAAVVGKYMLAELPDHAITHVLHHLLGAEQWVSTIKYRNRWVHDQPPLLGGFGIMYKRKRRWNKTSQGYSIGIGLGDEPDYLLEDVLNMISTATQAFAEAMESLFAILLQSLKSAGIEVDSIVFR